jgi:hypothetical protein
MGGATGPVIVTRSATEGLRAFVRGFVAATLLELLVADD